MNDEQIEHYRKLLRDRATAQNAHDDLSDRLFPDAAKPLDLQRDAALPSVDDLQELDRLLQEQQAAERRLRDWIETEPGLR